MATQKKELQARRVGPAASTSLWSLLFCLLISVNGPLAGFARAGQPPSVVTARELLPATNTDEVVRRLVRKNNERYRALQSYEGTRTYRLNYTGFPGSRSAIMVVDVKYQLPGTKEFTIRSASGSKLIIDRVFKKLLQTEGEAFREENQKHTALNLENYRFTLLGSEAASGGALYVLSVEPVVPSKFLYRGKIWVDGRDFAVVRIEGQPAKNPSFWTKDTRIEQVYRKVNNFWLPASNRSVSTVRLGGHADFSIDYTDYRGLPQTGGNGTTTVASGR